MAATEAPGGTEVTNGYSGPTMSYEFVIWDLDDEVGGNVEHIAQHGLTKDDVEEVLRHPEQVETSRSSGHPVAFGYTDSGRQIAVVFEEIDPDTVRPITAYET